MSSQTLLESLDVNGNFYDLATTFVGEVKKQIANPSKNTPPYPADGYMRNVQPALDQDAFPASLTHFFNEAVRIHKEISTAHENNFVAIDLDPHHYNFDNKGNLRIPDLIIKGLPELSAAALLYNPITPLSSNSTPQEIKNFDDRSAIIFDASRTNDKLNMLARVGEWDADLMKQYLFIRSVANCANRLVYGTPEGQFDAKYWEDYIVNVAAPIAGVKALEIR